MSGTIVTTNATTSLLLDQSIWDLVLDTSGNIAVCSQSYSIAQDVACMIRTFKGECWYDQTIGITYFDAVLGHFPPLSLLKKLISTAAATVPGCGNPINVFFTSFEKRVIRGQVQFTDSFQNLIVVAIAPRQGQFILGVSSLGGTDII